MSTPKDRANEPSRGMAIGHELEKLQGKYAYELSHPEKYDHGDHKDNIERDFNSMVASEHHMPASWLEK